MRFKWKINEIENGFLRKTLLFLQELGDEVSRVKGGWMGRGLLLVNNISKMLKEGRGTGKGKQYILWIKIQDVPSLGRVTRLRGIKTGRQHEFLSDMERDYFYFLEYSDKVNDIREQIPLLPIEETLLIAKELGIEHPKNPETGEFIVMNTMYLPKAVEKLREKEEVNESLLKHISPIGWEHINFIGQYNFDDNSDYNLVDNMRPLRELLK